MKITQIQNGDSGLVARTAINEAIKSVDTDSSISGDGNTSSALSVVGLSAIIKTITATAKAVYIYDTSKDTTDWRHNKNTSWYNEPLNTATRGATREFPAVALIVAETNKITVYDATNPLLPMWRVFNTVAWQGWGSFNSLACKNGVIYLTANQNDGINGNLQIIDFINDEVKVINSTGTYIKNTGSRIADSNIAGTASIYLSTTTKLIHNTALRVAIATLKDGTDAIYVATQAGLTRIADDGSVSYWNDLGGVYSYVASAAINNDRVFFNVLNSQDALRVIYQSVDTPLVNTASTTGMAYSGLNTDIHTNALTPLHVAGVHAFSLRVAEKVLFSAKGLYLIKPNSSSYGLGLHASITSNFNSGYQYGDIKGAWLADTVAGAVTGGTVADRSYNNSPLTINGTLTKTAVNTGCELVWFNYSLAQTAATAATGYIEWWEEVAGVPTRYVKNLAGTGDYVDGRTGTVSSSVSIVGGTLTINAGVNITLLKVGNGFPTVEQIAHAYNQEKHLFNPNTACTLAGTSDDCVDVDYDSDTGLHHVATTTNKSVFKGLVRVSSKVGAFTTVSAQNDYVAEG